MQWIINKSLIEDMPSTWSTGNCQLSDIPESLRQKIRLVDGDDEVYFTGWVNKTQFDNACADDAFEPADNFGSAYGAGNIEYIEAGIWRPL